MRRGDVVMTVGRVWAHRRLTRAEIKEWEDGPDSKGYDDSGETKLPPQVKSDRIEAGVPLIVTRGSVPSDEARQYACCECQLPDGRVLFFRKKDLVK